MGILAKNIDGQIVAAHTRIVGPTYTLVVAEYLTYTLPHDGWDYYESVEAAHVAHGIPYTPVEESE